MAACAALDKVLAAVWAKTAGCAPEHITARRIEALRKEFGDYVRVRVHTSPATTQSWGAITGEHGNQTVDEVFLQSSRRPHAQMPQWAREANGVVLGLGAAPAAPWRYLVIPPASVRYIATAEQLPAAGVVYRAEDGTRVTVTVPARPGADGRARAAAERFSTAGAADAARVSWFGGRTLAATFETYAPPGLLAALEPGWSYTFILHDAEFQPYEQESAGLWFVCAVELESRSVSYEPPPGCRSRDRLNGQPPRAVAAARRMSRDPGRPFYGITIETPTGTVFVESLLYRRLRTTLYDADPMDREVGPECRLQMRGIRAYLLGGAQQQAFAEYFPLLSGPLYSRLETVLLRAAQHLVQLTGAHYGRAAKKTGAATNDDCAGGIMGQYFFAAVKSRPELLALLHPAAEHAVQVAHNYIAQPAHLDIITRILCPQLDPAPLDT
jgi:hypothetical protein